MGRSPRASITIRARVRAPPELAASTARSTPSAAALASSGPRTASDSGRGTGSAGCRRSVSRAGRMAASNSLAHRRVSLPFRARCMAMAVPIAPAPNTVTLAIARQDTWLQDGRAAPVGGPVPVVAGEPGCDQHLTQMKVDAGRMEGELERPLVVGGPGAQVEDVTVGSVHIDGSHGDGHGRPGDPRARGIRQDPVHPIRSHELRRP